MSRFSIALIRLATLALLGSAGTAAYAQQTIDQNKALAGNVTPGDAPGFPITISVPGSYKLMSNLHVPAGVQGISITADNVTLDLNGFTVRGPFTCTRNEATRVVNCGAKDENIAGGIVAHTQSGIVVRNGSVRGFANTGLYMNGGATVEKLHISHNNGFGLAINRGHVSDVIAEMNAWTGVDGAGALVAGSISRRNGDSGFCVTLLQESLSASNKAYGVTCGARVRGTVGTDNGAANFSGVVSMGGNVNHNTPF